MPFDEDYWEAIFYLDDKGGVINVGEDYLKRAGYTQAYVKRQKFLDLVDEEGRKKYSDIVERTIKEKEIDDVIMNLVTKDGTKILCNFAMTLIRDLTGAILGIAAIGEEVTHLEGLDPATAEKFTDAVKKLEAGISRLDSLLDELKAMQKQLSGERVAVVTTLITTVTHEINNSLAGIVANANLLADFIRELPTTGDAVSKERNTLLERLRSILECADRISGVITRLTQMQKVAIEEGTKGIPMIDLGGGPDEPKG
jgi:PAS domain S-box-containing protein